LARLSSNRKGRLAAPGKISRAYRAALCRGGRVVNTVSSKITRMTPVQGCCASAGGAIMLFAATYLGIPVSTTHTVTGSVIGVGAARKASAVRWNIATNIVIAWIVTIPASALMAVLFYVLSGLIP
jgi:PiT family inorganic phosphate transporter